ncbi:MAG TPA: DoxX family protein [Mariniphaga sp.]|nr:DoxX family protein [Mariniphaga sp.]
MNPIKRIFKTHKTRTFILLRIIVGLVFLSEGIQKFLFPEIVGEGRFEKIGFDYATFFAYFVAVFEIVCGTLVLLGLLTRIATVPLLVIMLTAIVTTKFPILINDGFWFMAHAARTDFAMTLLLVFLLIYGPGKFSLDNLFYREKI